MFKNAHIKKMGQSSLLVMSTLAFAGCSTIVNGTNQAVKFNTGSVNAAKCTVTGGSDNAVNIDFVSPAEISIPRSKKALNIKCNKAGYAETTKTVNSKLEGSTGGNILAGGVIGVGVDALTGAMYKYPGTISIIMESLDKISLLSKPSKPQAEQIAATPT